MRALIWVYRHRNSFLILGVTFILVKASVFFGLWIAGSGLESWLWLDIGPIFVCLLLYYYYLVLFWLRCLKKIDWAIDPVIRFDEASNHFGWDYDLLLGLVNKWLNWQKIIEWSSVSIKNMIMQQKLQKKFVKKIISRKMII